MIQIRQLRKSFANHTVLDSIDLHIPAGSIFGLLGPNGASKTTLIRILAGIYSKDSGSITFSNPSAKIGYLPEERGLYPKMKVLEQLVFFGRLHGMTTSTCKKVIHFWLKRLDLLNWRNARLEELSKGMQQKVQFIISLLHDPDILILDEPFVGLDPINTDFFKKRLTELRIEGKTIILSTHRMESVEELCDHIAMINKARIVLNGSMQKVRDMFKKNKFWVSYATGNLPADLPIYEVKDNVYGYHEALISSQRSPSELLKKLLSEGVEVLEFRELRPSMEEIFVNLVKGNKASIE